MSQVTILVVDDDKRHAELVRRNLHRSGIGNPIVALTAAFVEAIQRLGLFLSVVSIPSDQAWPS
jgi:CheY-like chemotaxis protein